MTVRVESPVCRRDAATGVTKKAINECEIDVQETWHGILKQVPRLRETETEDGALARKKAKKQHRSWFVGLSGQVDRVGRS